MVTLQLAQPAIQASKIRLGNGITVRNVERQAANHTWIGRPHRVCVTSRPWFVSQSLLEYPIDIA